MRLTGKRILITGGAGFIGSKTAELLMAEHVAEVIVLDNLERGRFENTMRAAEAGSLRLVKGDIRDPDVMHALLTQTDIVFHMAALRITQCAEEPEHAFGVMASATFDLLKLCVTHNIEKIVAASSASVYGLAKHFPTDESENPYANRTLYGALKAFNEAMLRSFNEMYGLAYCAMRYFNVYGPGMDVYGKYTEVLIRWIERIDQGEPPIIFGDGSQTMDFIHVRDVAQANLAAAKADVTDDVFNVATGAETSLRELAQMLLEVMGRPDLTVQYYPERSVNAVGRRLGNVTKATMFLNFHATTDLRDGLKELVDWWSQEKQARRTATSAENAH